MHRQNITIAQKAVALAAVLITVPAFAQYGAPPPAYPPGELERMVSRIALYPDPLLAQILAAATYADQIPDAAAWADRHHYLNGDQLARSISEDRLPWDPSVQALLPFPSVLDMMRADMNWTSQLGNAFLAQPQDVMDAVQRMRQRARDYGYLRSNGQIVVGGSGPYIEIMPVNPGYVIVPYYDPLVVYARPRPGFVMTSGINFGFGVAIGSAFRPWGWGGNRFVWSNHTVIVNNRGWDRRWVNRTTYVHPYEVQRYSAPRVEERHEVRERPREVRERERPGRYREDDRRR
jgi:hypothetical protein